jgi:hypothetical protein
VTVERVKVTEAAVGLIRKLRAAHGPLMFHQSGGCCDGSSPMCYPAGEFRIGQNDIRLGEVEGYRFLTRSRVFTEEEAAELAVADPATRGPQVSRS